MKNNNDESCDSKLNLGNQYSKIHHFKCVNLESIGIANHFLELENKIDSFTSALENLKSLFNERLKYDAAKDNIIKILHGELDLIKPQYVYSVKKNLINSLLVFYDRVKEVEHSFSIGTIERMRLESLRRELVDRLFVEDVEIIVTDSDIFDNRIQKVNVVVSTNDPTKDLAVFNVIQDGFTYKGKIIRTQLVSVYRYSDS